MSISSTTRRITYAGTGALDTYSVTFLFRLATDLKITLYSSVGDLISVLVLNTDYTVDVESSEITLLTGNLASGQTLIIEREVDVVQETELRNQGPYYPETIEAALDDQAMISQQLSDGLAKTMQVVETETVIGQLPTLAERKGMFLAFDQTTGDPIAAGGALVGVPVTPFAMTLLDDLNASEMLTTLGFSSYFQTLVSVSSLSNFQTLLGMSTFFKTLLDDADAATFLSSLGVSAYIQTLLNDADAATARTTLGGVPTLTGVETLTNKTLTTPILDTPKINGSKKAMSAVQTSGFTASALFSVYRCSVSGGGFTVTLPAASGNDGLTFLIKKTDTSLNLLTIDANGSELIDGSLTTVIHTQGESVEIYCDGTGWTVIRRIIPSISATYTPTIAGFGTVVSPNFEWRRYGDSVRITGYVTSGTVAGSAWSMTLPGGNTVAGVASATIYGSWWRINNGTNAVKRGTLIAANGSTSLNHAIDDYVTNAAPNQVLNGSGIFGNGQVMHVDVLVPILGWNA